MTAPAARILADSVSPRGHRLTTMEVTFHRFVLAEFNTHRRFSRNSASSRAIPLHRQLDTVKGNPAMPLEWGREQRGMQSGDELGVVDRVHAQNLFNMVHLDTVDNVQGYVQTLKDIYPDDYKEHTLHKSLLNRLLEPFAWHTVIVSATEWQNFFDQRCSPLAQPEIRVVAEKMEEALHASTPKPIKYGDWHIPLIQPDEEHLDLNTRIQVGIARCARVSYLTHDGKRDIEEDLNLFDRLVSADPPHLSPLEHVAKPAWNRWRAPLGNFDGWHQFRHVGKRI